jgi:hypothetical protein
MYKFKNIIETHQTLYQKGGRKEGVRAHWRAHDVFKSERIWRTFGCLKEPREKSRSSKRTFFTSSFVLLKLSSTSNFTIKDSFLWLKALIPY